jgi:dihydroneopterin aldolase
MQKNSKIIGQVGFEALQVKCIIGDLAEERETPQVLIIDMMAELDFTKVIATNNLEDTVCYVALANMCEEIARDGKYKMLETLAGAITEAILQKFPVESVFLKIRKPAALGGVLCPVVELTQKRVV